MTLLTLIQRTFRRVGLTAPSAAVGSTEENILRLIELANEEGEELSERYPWQVLINEATLTTSAAESQGAMTTIAGASFAYIQNDTMWNRTTNRRWLPVDDVQWQQMKASGITGPDYYFRIRGGNLIVQPTPTASQTVCFEWVSKNWCTSSGGTGQSQWAADDDVLLLPAEVFLMGLVWRWKKAQGLEYAEDFRQYEIRAESAMIRDGAKKRINFAGGRSTRQNIPEGSWSL